MDGNPEAKQEGSLLLRDHIDRQDAKPKGWYPKAIGRINSHSNLESMSCVLEKLPPLALNLQLCSSELEKAEEKRLSESFRCSLRTAQHCIGSATMCMYHVPNVLAKYRGRNIYFPYYIQTSFVTSINSRLGEEA